MTSQIRTLFSRQNTARDQVTLDFPSVSLLWPAEKPTDVPGSQVWHRDLDLNTLVRAMTWNRRYESVIFQTLAALVTDPEVITWRQQVLLDLLNNPPLLMRLRDLLPQITSLREGNPLLGGRQRSLLLATSDRLAELDLYVTLVQNIAAALNEAQLEAPAMGLLRDHLDNLLEQDHFERLRQELPELRAPLESIASLTIGVNLDTQLHPESAVLLAVNDRKIGDMPSLLERLIGVGSGDNLEKGIAPLHQLPRERDQRVLTPLFQDLDRLLNQVAQPVARALYQYSRVSSSTLIALEHELGFFVGAAEFIRELQDRGITFCKPEPLPADDRTTDIHELTNINLAITKHMNPTASNLSFDAAGRIAILTGPNSGGKTTYLQAVGLAQVLFQAGLLVPAERARLSPVDRLLTHFPRLETQQQGRLAEEASRLRDIFQHASAHSLVLLNETFSSTSSSEAMYLAQDILCGLRSIGVRGVYATHFVELVDHIDSMRQTVTGSSELFSLVAGVRQTEDGRVVPTFEITRGSPLGRSYAQEIARRHGISLEQILELRQPSPESSDDAQHDQ
jgi:hypothetical protein